MKIFLSNEKLKATLYMILSFVQSEIRMFLNFDCFSLHISSGKYDNRLKTDTD